MSKAQEDLHTRLRRLGCAALLATIATAVHANCASGSDSTATSSTGGPRGGGSAEGGSASGAGGDPQGGGGAGGGGEGGEGGHDPNDAEFSWAVEVSGTARTLTAVWASEHHGVFAVGYYGTILHSWGDGSWSEIASGTEAHLTSVGGSMESDVLIGGVRYCLTTDQCHLPGNHVDGGLFRVDVVSHDVERVEEVPQAPVVWVHEEQVVVSVDGSTMMTSADRGHTWGTEVLDNLLSVHEISGADMNDLYALAVHGLFKREGGVWHELDLPLGASHTYMDLWGSRAGDMYMTTIGYDVLRGDPVGGWTHSVHAQQSYMGQSPGPYMDIWGSSDQDVYMVTGGDFADVGRVVHSTGDDDWVTVDLGFTPPPLYAVGGTSSADVYVVGAQGAIVHGRLASAEP